MRERSNEKVGWLLNLILIIALSVVACMVIQRVGQKHRVTDNSQTGVTVLEKTPYYEIIQNDKLFFCYFYDGSHTVVKEEGPIAKPLKVLKVEEGVFRLTAYAGTGVGTQWGYYYDAESGTFSRVFHCIYDQSNGLVACADAEKVIVQSIFDADGFYMEIDNFGREFSKTIEPFAEIKFLNSGNSISITYRSGADFQEINEVFPLR